MPVIINEPELAMMAQKVVKKLWGVEFWIVNTECYCLKFLKVNPGFQCSIHAHAEKDETFVGVSGTLKLNLHARDGALVEVIGLDPGKRYRIGPQTYHSFEAHNVTWVLEVSTHHDDDDVFRIAESRKL